MKNKMEFKIDNDTLTVYFFGDIDHQTTLNYRDRLVEKIDSKKFKRVILNFGSVTFIDSSGIGMVLGRYNQVKRYNGQLFLAELPEATYRLFDLTGLFSIISVIPTKEEVKAYE